MNTYDVSKCVAEYLKPGVPLHTWYGRQTRKPYLTMDLSLYQTERQNGRSVIAPVGTVIENGTMVHNDGNGYGVGIIGGDLLFGGPWDRPWQSYVTGYTTCVIDGRYVAPTFSDNYVFNSALNRIGIGTKLDGSIYVVTDDGVTLKTFAEHAVAEGFVLLVNCDGGASRSLNVNGRQICQSSRTPYNALAFYLPEGAEAPKGECPYNEPKNVLSMLSGNGAKWLQWNLRNIGITDNDGNLIEIDGAAGAKTAQGIIKLFSEVRNK